MTPSLDEIQERLQKILLDGLTEPLSLDQLSGGPSLSGDGAILDSIALLELVVGIENEFDIHLDEDSLALEHFASLESLSRVIQDKLSGKLVREPAA